MDCAREMPKYKSHKTVWALKIKNIKCGTAEDAGGILIPEELGYAPIKVSKEYMNKHNPVVGGYYVVYEDGYLSFSPAEAFENGYTKMEE